MENYDKEPKMNELIKVNKPTDSNPKKPGILKISKNPVNSNEYAQAKEDNSIYYEYITNLFEPPRLETIDIRIIEMERSLCAMIDEEDLELAPPLEV